VVVEVGLTPVEPLAELEAKLPGVMAIDVAPVVDQLSVLLDPEFMLVGFAVKDVIAGFVVMGPGEEDDEDDAPHAESPAQANDIKSKTKRFSGENWRKQSSRLFPPNEFVISISAPWKPACTADPDPLDIRVFACAERL
jgi:hypothetical protein